MTTSPEPEVDFDVIVVGAGIAGSLTAFLLARAGHSVVLIERGDEPGSKNLSGGVLYTHSLRSVFPDLIDRAPIERRITRNCVQFLNGHSAVGIDYRDTRLGDPVNAVTVLRAKFDRWLANEAEEAGAFLMPGVRVDRVLSLDTDSHKRIVGVKAGADELRAKVVVAADGVNSFIAREAGLRADPTHEQLAIGVKSVVSLPRTVIEDRFGLTGDDGAAWAVVGDCTEGVAGGGFVYTNVSSVSIGVVLRLDDLIAKEGSAAEIHDHFLQHPYIAPYLEGGELAEYGCHLVAEGGWGMLGEVATDGMVVVGDAAGLTLNTGLTVRGMDLAADSAIAAADAIHLALEHGDTSKTGLRGYRERLLASTAGKDLRTYAKAPHFFERDRTYTDYGNLVADIMYGAFNHDGTPRQHLKTIAHEALKASPVSVRDLVGDGLAGVRAL